MTEASTGDDTGLANFPKWKGIVALLLGRVKDLTQSRGIPRLSGPRTRVATVLVATAASLSPGLDRTRLGQAARHFLFLRTASGQVQELLQSLDWAAAALGRQITKSPQEAIAKLTIAQRTHELLRLFIGAEWVTNLAHVSLEGLELDLRASSAFVGADLAGCSLTQICIYGDIRRARFSNATLTRCKIAAAWLNSVDLHGSELHETSFLYTDMASVNFCGSRLTNVSIIGCNLAGASFSGASLNNVEFLECDLERTNFDDTSLLSVRFEHCTHGDLVSPSDLASRLVEPDVCEIRSGSPEQSSEIWGASPIASQHANYTHPELRDIVARYSEEVHERLPPLGFRLGILIDKLILVTFLFPNNRRIRDQTLQATQDPRELRMIAAALPQHAMLSAFREFLFPSRIVVGALGNALIDAHLISARGDADAPESKLELLWIESPTPFARSIDLGSRRRGVIISSAMEVFLNRLAKCSIAWVLPLAVEFQEEGALTAKDIRLSIANSFHEIMFGSGSPADLPLIRLQGLRRMEAMRLTQTWLHYAVWHEEAHGLPRDEAPMRDLLQEAHEMPVPGVAALEIACDVYAARRLALHEDQFNGDKEMAQDAYRIWRSDRARTLAGFQVDDGAHHYPDYESFLAALDLLAVRSAWLPTAICLFTILFQTSRNGCGDPRTALARAKTAVRLAYGLPESDRLDRDLLDPATVVGLAAWICSQG